MAAAQNLLLALRLMR